MKKSLTARAPGMTQISISLPAELVGKIDTMAAAENRNRSNFIANTLLELSRRHPRFDAHGAAQMATDGL